MAEKRFKVSITLLVAFVLLAGLLRFTPLSISFGERDDTNWAEADAFFQPGNLYLVQVKEPIGAPAEIHTTPCGFMGSGFLHDGKREDDKGRYCGGDVSTLLQDNGHRKYKCVRCGKTWEQSPDAD